MVWLGLEADFDGVKGVFNVFTDDAGDLTSAKQKLAGHSDGDLRTTQERTY